MYNRALPDRAMIACPHCDLLQRLPEVGTGASARCPRCALELWRHRPDSTSRTLALAIAAALLYVIANLTPMLGLEVVGRRAETTVFGGVRQLWLDGRETVAVLVLATAIVAPALQIGFLLAIVVGGRRPRPPRWVGTLLRHQPTTRIWSMIEVMLIGVLVSLVKIAELATVIPGIAMFALGALVVLLAAMQSTFDSHDIWARVVWAEEEDAAIAAAHGAPSEVAP